MNKFLIKVIVFSILLLGINVFFHELSYALYSKKFTYPKLNFKSYILTDSHGGRLGTLPETYGVYNFSTGSDSYSDSLRKLNYLVKYSQVETVYINVTPHCLSPHKTGVNNLSHSSMYTSVEDYRNVYYYIKIKYIKRYLPFFQTQDRQVTRGFFIAELKLLTTTGSFKPAPKESIAWEHLSPAIRHDMATKRADYLFFTDKTSPEMERDLLEIIAVCKRHNIQLIGVKFPLANEYQRLIKTKSDRAAELLRSHGFAVLDYSTLFNDHLDYFANQDHLNKKGAEAFVEYVWGKRLFIKRVHTKIN